MKYSILIEIEDGDDGAQITPSKSYTEATEEKQRQVLNFMQAFVNKQKLLLETIRIKREKKKADEKADKENKKVLDMAEHRSGTGRTH